MPRKKLSDEQIQRLKKGIEMVKKGNSVYTVAKDLNLNFETLRKHCIKNNIQLQQPKIKKEIIFIENLVELKFKNVREYKEFLRKNNYSHYGFASYLLSEYQALKQTIRKSSELLNILNDENLKLKKELQDKESKKNKIKKIEVKTKEKNKINIAEKEKRILQLEEENERLKKENEQLKKIIAKINSEKFK